MGMTTIEVPESVAKAYQSATETEREYALFRMRIELARGKRVEDVLESMREVGEKAQANGLTPEVLQRLLDEED